MDENKEDQPLSSEEMLRRAREGLGDSSSTPPPSAPAGDSYSSIESEFDSEMDPVYEEEEMPADASREPLAYEPPPREPRAYEPPPAEPPPAPNTTAEDTVGHWAPPKPEPADEGAGSWAPPAPEPDSGSWDTQLPSPQPSTRRKSGIGKIVFIIAVVAIGGVFVSKMFDSSKTVDRISVGDCMDVPEGDEFSTVEPIDCSNTHDLEVFAIIDMSSVSAAFSPGVAYPGADPLYNAALDACTGQPFESYVGVPYDSLGVSDTLLWVDAFTPTMQGWREFDDREVQCILLQLDSDTGQVVQSTHSFEGSNGI